MKQMNFILALILVLISAIPALAVDKMVKSIDATIEVPTAGMKLKDYPSKLLSAKTSYGDLAKNNAVTIQNIHWEGTFGKDANGDRVFQAGFSYRAKLTFLFTNEGATKYYANYINKNGSIYLDGTLFSATINGRSATTEVSAPRAPVVDFIMQVEGDISSEVVANANAKFKETVKKKRTTNSLFEVKAADRYLAKNNPHDVFVYTEKEHFEDAFKGDEQLYVDKIIADGLTSNYSYEQLALDMIYVAENARELWLAPNIDVVRFLKQIYESMLSRVFPNYKASQRYQNYSVGICTSDLTLYVPEGQLSAAKAYFASTILHPVYKVKAYKGDVYAAQKAGAAYDICAKHVYTAAIASADRVYRYATCTNGTEFYYSCTNCGKIERNPQHVFHKVQEGPKVVAKDPNGGLGHQYEHEIANDESYIGVNAAGDHVYWTSCAWCGHGEGYLWEHPYAVDLLGFKTQKEKDTERKNLLVQKKHQEELALVKDRAQPQMFTMPKRTKAKVSADLKSDVNYALCENLVDESLLGNDYTVAITRQQLLSIAVLLAEELTEKTVKESSASTYSDTKDKYALKAATMGLTADIVGSQLNPKATVSRQEMVTVLYRVLCYVEKHSDYAYTDFTSKLSRYTDSSRLKPWAVEPMAFFDALGLIKGTSSTTIGGDAACSIELALAVAYRGTYAHELGWYQARPTSRVFKGTTTNWASGESAAVYTFRCNDRIWVIGRRTGPNNRAMPVIDPYSGGVIYVISEYYHPVRRKGNNPEDKVQKSTKSSGDKSSKKTKNNDVKSATKKLKKEGVKILKKGLKDIVK